MFFTVHSSGTFYDLEIDRKLDGGRLELCTCGRSSCQQLAPSALKLVGPAVLDMAGNVKQSELRVCEHRIKSRLINSIQGRGTKVNPRTDQPFSLSVDVQVNGKLQSLPIRSHTGDGTPAKFRVAAKPELQQKRCSARSCAKKKTNLQLCREELLNVMTELGYRA